MSKSRTRFYAVAVGRDAPKIHTKWEECLDNVTRYPKALHKSFSTQGEAEYWLKSQEHMTVLYANLKAPEERGQIFRGTHSSSIPVNSEDELQGSRQKANESGRGIGLESNSSPEQQVALSSEQAKVYSRVREGKNVFFTGSAGTGKSVLLREIIKHKNGYRRDDRASCAIAITASTGIAALNIGGVTLHSWAGIKLGDEPVQKFIGKVLRQPSFEPVLKRWRQVETLIIDEISMIDGSLFDYLEEVARGLRRSFLPFGGIQLVLCGDFCQLPPVSGKDRKGREIPAKFAFEAESWNPCIGTPMMLRKVFRQKDQTFANMLNEMRYGKMQESTIQIFKSLSRTVTYSDGIEPTEMYPTRREVANANAWRLKQLPGSLQTYEAQDHKGVDHKNQPISYEQMLSLLDRLVAPKTLELKVGAQVMLVKNLKQGILVNGSIGRVVRFDTPSEAAKHNTKIAQVEPARINGETSGGNPITREILKHEWKWPVVKFTNGEEMMVTPTDFTINNGDSETMTARRLQLPLILAWALSVHKSQGQTLERVRVDLRRTFEKGQAYVALSRATNMDHLQVLNFSKEKVMAHPKVLAWYGEHVGRKDEDMGNDEFDFDELSAFDEYHQ